MMDYFIKATDANELSVPEVSHGKLTSGSVVYVFMSSEILLFAHFDYILQCLIIGSGCLYLA